MKTIFSILLFVIHSSFCLAQDKMKFYEDTAKMKEEVLSYIPIGTDTARAHQIMLGNKFDFEGDYVNETFLSGGNIDFLFFMHDEGIIFCMNRWKIALVYKDGKVSDVQVQFVIICL